MLKPRRVRSKAAIFGKPAKIESERRLVFTRVIWRNAAPLGANWHILCLTYLCDAPPKGLLCAKWQFASLVVRFPPKADYRCVS